MLNAHLHNTTYKGASVQSDGDADRGARAATRLLQRSVNKMDMELSITQAAMLLLGYEADGSSESFVPVRPWSAVLYAEELLAEAAGVGAEQLTKMPVRAKTAQAGRPRRARGDDDSEGGADESDESDTNDSFITSDEEEGEGGGSDSESGGAGSDEDPYLHRLAAYDPCADADAEEEDDVPMVDAPFSSNPFIDNDATCVSADEDE